MSEIVDSAAVQQDRAEDNEDQRQGGVSRGKKRSFLWQVEEKIVAFLFTYIRLLIAGLVCETIYGCYLLRTFPLLAYYKIFTDMGGINKYSHPGLILFLVYISLLFLFVVLAWWEVYQRQDRTSVWIVFTFGGVFAITTIFVYPVTAIDVFIYIAQNLVMVQHHANSMVLAPSHFFKDDSLMLLAGGDMGFPAPYGPLELYIQAVPTLIAGRNVIATLLIIKTMFAGMLFVEGWVVYKILQRLAPRLALAGALALIWNPFALFEYVANSHNDIVMMLFITLGIWALVEDKYKLALLLVTASALIKYVSVPLIPLFFIYSVWHLPTLRARVRYGVWALIAPVSLVLLCFAPFWQGAQTFANLAYQVQSSLFSFSLFLNDFSSQAISVEQADQIGTILLGVCCLYAAWKATRDIVGMLHGCFIVIFAVFAFGATYNQVWYLIGPFILAILVPRVRETLVGLLLVYAAMLVEIVHAYVWPQGAIFYPGEVAIVNSIAYMVLFLPPMLLMFGLSFVQLFKVRQRLTEVTVNELA